MANPALVIRVAANLAELKANLADGKLQIEALGPSMQRLATSFSGERLVQRAQDVVAAINQIGGAAKLTGPEAARQLDLLERAMEKMRMTGQGIPPEMVKTAAALKQVAPAASTATDSLKRFFLQWAAGIASLAAIKGVVNQALEFASRMTDLAARTGMSTAALQEFEFAGRQVGVSLESIIGAVGQMQKRLAGGEDSAERAVTKLGLSLGELRSLRPEDQFTAIASRIAQIEDPAARAKLAMDLMGRGALETMPLLVSNLAAVRDEAQRLGVVVGENTIQQLDQMGDRLDALKLRGRAMMAEFVTPLLPLLDLLGRAFGTVGNWIGKAQIAFEQLGSVLADKSATMAGLTIKVLELTNTFGSNTIAINRAKEIQAQLVAIAKDLSVTQDRVVTTSKAAAVGFAVLDVEAEKIKVSHERVAVATRTVTTAQAELLRGLPLVRDVFSQLATVYLPDTTLALERAKASMEGLNRDGTLPVSRGISTLLNDVKLFSDVVAVNTAKITAARTRTIEWRDGLAGLTQAFAQAAQIGGAAFSGIARAIGSVLGAFNLLTQATSAMNKGLSAMAAAGASIGAKLGGFLTFAGGAASVIGSLFQVSSLLDKLFGRPMASGANLDRIAVVDLRNELMKTFGTTQNLAAAFRAVGMDMNQAFAAGKTGLTSFQQKWAELQAALDKYGLTWLNLGPTMQQAKIDEMAKTLLADMNMLQTAGVDYDVILQKTAADTIALLQASLQTGRQVPPEFIQIALRLKEMGLLLDANGQAIDLAAIKFADLSKTSQVDIDAVTNALQSTLAKSVMVSDQINKTTGDIAQLSKSGLVDIDRIKMALQGFVDKGILSQQETDTLATKIAALAKDGKVDIRKVEDAIKEVAGKSVLSQAEVDTLTLRLAEMAKKKAEIDDVATAIRGIGQAAIDAAALTESAGGRISRVWQTVTENVRDYGTAVETATYGASPGGVTGLQDEVMKLGAIARNEFETMSARTWTMVDDVDALRERIAFLRADLTNLGDIERLELHIASRSSSALSSGAMPSRADIRARLEARRAEGDEADIRHLTSLLERWLREGQPDIVVKSELLMDGERWHETTRRVTQRDLNEGRLRVPERVISPEC